MISNDQLETFKPWLISVARTGSSTLPWISAPHDTDYVFYVQDKHDIKQIVELFKLRPENECWIVSVLADNNKTRPYSYEYYYLQPLYGTELPKYNIFEHITEYKQELIKHGLSVPFSTKPKFWYHILTGIYLLDNGEYNLTEEQIKNINLCHDRQMTQEIYDFIQQKLNAYQNKLTK